MQLFKTIYVFFLYKNKFNNIIIMKKGIMLVVAVALLSFAAHSQSKETRDLKGFSKVSFGIPGELYIDFGSDFKVVLEGDEDDLEETITEISSGRLVIRHERGNWNFNENKVIVHITMPEIEGLSVSGSGKAEISDQVKDADNLDLNVSGSGRLITSGITADNFNCSISGSGNIVIDGEGNADNGEIAISGSGNYTGEQMEIDHLDITLSGSGNCLCKVGDELSASVSGSGNVNYIGNPELDARVSGSGRVRSR